MVVLPVIDRELRASARHPFTYYLRTLGAGALLLAIFFFGLENGFESSFGGKLFGYLHFTMFYAIWILVPLLASDCISRERREGTLGLLFMLPNPISNSQAPHRNQHDCDYSLRFHYGPREGPTLQRLRKN